jgi:hypothetical protein
MYVKSGCKGKFISSNGASIECASVNYKYTECDLVVRKPVVAPVKPVVVTKWSMMSTPNSGKYNNQLALKGLKEPYTVSVTVEAKNDAHIFLSKGGAPSQKNGYEIVLGGWANSKSVIRTGTQKPANGVVRYHGKVVGSKKTFTIEKTATTLTIKRADGTTLLTYDKATRKTVEMYLMTGWGATGKWSWKIVSNGSSKPVVAPAKPPCTTCSPAVDGFLVNGVWKGCYSSLKAYQTANPVTHYGSNRMIVMDFKNLPPASQIQSVTLKLYKTWDGTKHNWRCPHNSKQYELKAVTMKGFTEACDKKKKATRTLKATAGVSEAITIKNNLGAQSVDVTSFVKKALDAKSELAFTLAGKYKSCLSAFTSQNDKTASKRPTLVVTLKKPVVARW